LVPPNNPQGSLHTFLLFLNSFSNPKPSIRGAKMRYYEQRYPEVDELVMVQVRQIAEMGAYVKLVSTVAIS
jgi:hypothetical protein